MTRQQIEKVVKYCSKELKLPVPKVYIHDEGWFIGSFKYDDSGKVSLGFLADRLDGQTKNWEYESCWKFLKYKPRYRWEYPFLVIAHEMGHYLQFKRHLMWLASARIEVDDYLEKYKKFSIKKYHNFKIEKNANKIALILLKKARKNKFRLDK